MKLGAVFSCDSKDILCGDSEQMQIPGGFGAAGQPNDGWHQYLHLLNRSYCAAAVGWSNSILLRKRLDELNLSVQGSLSTKPVGGIVSHFFCLGADGHRLVHLLFNIPTAFLPIKTTL